MKQKKMFGFSLQNFVVVHSYCLIFIVWRCTQGIDNRTEFSVEYYLEKKKNVEKMKNKKKKKKVV